MRILTSSTTEALLIFIYFSSLILILWVSGTFPTILWFISFLGLITLYIMRSDDVLYSIAMGLTFLLAIGVFYKINHLPGADLMLIIGLSTQVIFPILFFRSAFIHKESIDDYYWLIYALALVMCLQFIPGIVKTNYLPIFMNYLIFSVSFWLYWRNRSPTSFFGFHHAIRVIILSQSTSLLMHVSNWLRVNY